MPLTAFPDTTVILPAAGSGSRFGATLPKQYHSLDGIPIIVRTMRVFEQTPSVRSLVIAAAPEFHNQIKGYAQQYAITKLTAVIAGGRERQDSIAAALRYANDSEIVLVHDAVRPFITPAFVDMLIQAAREYHAVVPGLVPKETVKETVKETIVKETIVKTPTQELATNTLHAPTNTTETPHISAEVVRTTHQRSHLRLIQTPQGFRRDLLMAAYTFAAEQGFVGTDDASVVEFFGSTVRVIEGLEQNIKLTTRFDWAVAETIVRLDNTAT